MNITDGSNGCEDGFYVDHSTYSAGKGRGRLGYVEPGEFRDVIPLPPLSNITVSLLDIALKKVQENYIN